MQIKNYKKWIYNFHILSLLALVTACETPATKALEQADANGKTANSNITQTSSNISVARKTSVSAAREGSGNQGDAVDTLKGAIHGLASGEDGSLYALTGLEGAQSKSGSEYKLWEKKPNGGSWQLMNWNSDNTPVVLFETRNGNVYGYQLIRGRENEIYFFQIVNGSSSSQKYHGKIDDYRFISVHLNPVSPEGNSLHALLTYRDDQLSRLRINAFTKAGYQIHMLKDKEFRQATSRRIVGSDGKQTLVFDIYDGYSLYRKKEDKTLEKYDFSSFDNQKISFLSAFKSQKYREDITVIVTHSGDIYMGPFINGLTEKNLLAGATTYKELNPFSLGMIGSVPVLATANGYYEIDEEAGELVAPTEKTTDPDSYKDSGLNNITILRALTLSNGKSYLITLGNGLWEMDPNSLSKKWRRI